MYYLTSDVFSHIAHKMNSVPISTRHSASSMICMLHKSLVQLVRRKWRIIWSGNLSPGETRRKMMHWSMVNKCCVNIFNTWFHFGQIAYFVEECCWNRDVFHLIAPCGGVQLPQTTSSLLHVHNQDIHIVSLNLSLPCLPRLSAHLPLTKFLYFTHITFTH